MVVCEYQSRRCPLISIELSSMVKAVSFDRLLGVWLTQTFLQSPVSGSCLATLFPNPYQVILIDFL